MATTNPPQLFLLVDHIKLSLLERHRAASLSIPHDAQDRQIARSLEQLREGIAALESMVEDVEDESITTSLPRLHAHLSSLTTQFTPPTTTSSSSSSPPPPSSTPPPPPRTTKSVHFSSPSLEAPYRDTPSPPPPPPPDSSHLSNPQLLTHHAHILSQQDTQLDSLSHSISRQRDLSTAIGDELEGQIGLLDEVEEGVDRHAGQMRRARGRLERVGRKAGGGWSLWVIVVLIVILVLLIVITK